MSSQSKNKLPTSPNLVRREGGCVDCSRPDSYDDFVQCDQCDGWWHMRCAGVTKSISQRPWTCRTCLPLSVASSSSSARISLRLKQIEEERAIQQREWATEKRALEQERKALAQERMALQEKYKLLGDQLVERENATRRSHVSRRSSMRRVSDWVENLVDGNEAEGAVGGVTPGAALTTDHEAKGLKPSTDGHTANVVPQLEFDKSVHQSSNQRCIPMQLGLNIPLSQDGNQQQTKGAFPKTTPRCREPIDEGNVWSTEGNFTSYAPPVPPGKPLIAFKSNDKISTQTSEEAYKDLLAKFASVSVTPVVQNTLPNLATETVKHGLANPTVPPPTTMGGNEINVAHRANTDPHVTNMQSNAPGQSMIHNVPEQAPSPSQLAARQVMPRDLPVFSGDPADWPIFVSAFENTTVACGYSKVENLARLQRCLKGAAYESVRSRLLLPESVPQVINTLRLLFGRPELLINVLLNKLRATPAPKAEKLGTLIEFGMAVQSLCDHLVAAGQQSHLTNPYLLMELVEKLPAHVKMEWASYMQRYPEVNLQTFGNFMEGVMISASKVTLYTGGYTETLRTKGKASINTHVSEPELTKEGERICCVCKGCGHRVRECDSFKALSVDNRWKTVQFHELCRSCLCAHGKRSCRIASQCGINGCTFRHHPLLHSNRSNPASREIEAQNTESAGHHTHRLLNQSLLFRIIPVTLYGPKTAVQTFAFLDDGSQLTLVDEELTRELGVEGRKVPLCITWTGNVSRMERNSQQVRLLISGLDKEKQFNLDDVRTVKRLALPGQTLRLDNLIDKFPHLKGLQISGYENAVPRILIGVNNLHLTVPLKVKEGRINEPVATKTRLGWCIYGGNGTPSINSVNVHACECNSDQDLHDMVKDYFALEDVGAKSTNELVSAEDKRAQEILEQTTVRVCDRFETGLLWRNDDIEFPDSYGAAVRRLECLERRMKKSPLLKDELNRQIEEYQLKGYAHRANEKEMRAADMRRVWYLPIGAVIHPKKPEKVRLIWDAAAMVNGVSLNSFLLKGPDQLTSLLAVLVRFRQYAVAVSADIREMFHQIRIREVDRQSQRFLWRTDSSSNPDIFIMDVATFGSKCSPASAQYVKNKNAADHAQEFPRAAEEIIHNHYVDDYLSSFETEADAAEVAGQVKFIHSQGGFELRNWQSNSVVVLQRVGETEDSHQKRLFTDKNNKSERVLGMLWLVGNDELSFCTQQRDEVEETIVGNVIPTKRQVLRCLMSFFDPLGFLSFVFVHGKILLQDIWRAGVQWDEVINAEQWERWQMWTVVLRQISTIQIPRCYFKNAMAKHYRHLQLHIFVDASEGAYAAVAYFRIIDPNGSPRCALVAAKTKVAPLKPLSIPRLELQAAVLGTRLSHFVSQSHTVIVKQRYFWSDSTTVLAWLGADPRKYKQFVACRIGEILMETELNEWRWIPSKLNPADLATKWGNGPTLDINGTWFSGPSFLLQPEEEWPTQVVKQQTVEEELRTCNLHVKHATIAVIDCDRFSRWERLHRTTAYVHRFAANLKRQFSGKTRISGCLTQGELRLAEATLIGMAQWQEYPEEMSVLTRDRERPLAEQTGLEKHSPLYRSTPYIDDFGVLRVDGRIGAADHVDVDMKFPVILPRNHRVTTLIIEAFHRKFKHANSETVVNEIRQLYYVPRLRATVKRISSECMVCKLRKAVPQVPRMAALPPARLAAFARPFTYVGLDLFGPLVVKVGRGNAKRWIALFTCLTIRAVHCEVVYSLSTEACVKSVRRFVSRRGAPAEIHSDNGTNFRGAERILMEQIQQGVAATITSTVTKWLFIPPSSPHMGGAWERMVRSVKQAMIGAYNSNRKLDDESLLTFVTEAESIVNSRPLTYLPLDTEQSEALTPNHFLLGSSSGVRQPVVEPTDSSAVIKNTWSLINHQLDCFWKRWIRELLPTLTRRTKWFGEVRTICNGDLVLIIDENNRNNWIRGRVAQVITGSDGRVRQAIIRTAGGLLRRSVAKLAVLDIVAKGKTGTGGQCYGGEDITAGHTAGGNTSEVSSMLNDGDEMSNAGEVEDNRNSEKSACGKHQQEQAL